MLIEDYFQQTQLLIKSSKIVQLFNIECEKRGMYEGLIRGKIDLLDNSLLYFREFVYVEISIDRKMYSYQYMNSENNLILSAKLSSKIINPQISIYVRDRKD